MKKLFLILLAFLSFTVQAQFVVFTIAGGPSTQGAAAAPDTAQSFIVSAHDLDTANVNIIGMDDPDSVIVNYVTGLTPPATRFAGTIAIQTDDTLDVKNAKVKIDVPDDNTNYAFSGWYKANGSWQTDLQNDSTQLDSIGIVVPDFHADYYVDGVGTGDTLATIAEVNALTLIPGDTIAFKKGVDFREALLVPDAGDVSDRIVFMSSDDYGTGNNPRILGSNTSTWTMHQGDTIWVSDSGMPLDPGFPSSEYSSVWFESDSTVWGINQNAIVDLTAEYEWTWDSGSDLVYVYSDEDPDTKYTSVEMGQRLYSIQLNNQDYIEINGIDVMYGANAGIWDKYPTSVRVGLIVRNCEIAYIGRKAASSAYGIYTWQNNFLAEYNTIHDCGRRGISYFGSPGGAPEITVGPALIQNNTFYNGWHTASLDLIVASGSDVTIDSVIFRNNVITDYPSIKRGIGSVELSNHVFVADQSASGKGDVRNIYIYNNKLTYASGAGVKAEYVENLNVAHNTFYGFNTNIGIGGESDTFESLIQVTGDSSSTTKIQNNIIYSNSTYTDNVNLNGFSISKYLDTANVITIDYNLYGAADLDARIAVFYPESPVVAYTLGTWQDSRAALGYDVNSPDTGNIAFIDAPDNLRVEETSNAVSNGTPISYITTDILGNPRHPTTPTIGAYENLGAPLVVSAEVGTYSSDTVLVLFTEAFNTDSVPPESAFTLTEDGTAYGLDGIRLNGDTLFIGLDSSATHSVTYLLDYTRDYPQLQDVAGDTVESFTDQAVTNNMPTPPTVSSAELGTYNDTIISLVMNKALDTDSVPGAGSFNFTTSTTVITIQSVTLSGSTVYLHIDDNISGDSTLQLDYTKSAYPRLQSSVNVDAATWSNQAVTNNLPATPILQSIEVGTIDDSTFVLVFNTILDEDSIPTLASFTITEGTATLGLDSIRVTNDSIVIIADSICVSDSTYLGDWTQAYPRIQNVNGISAASWSDSSVTNNISGTSYCAKYQDVYDEFTTKPSAAVAGYWNQFVDSCVSQGIWAELDNITVFATHTNGAGEALINWIDPTGTKATAVSAPTFTASQGFTGDGAADYIDMNMAFSGGTNYAQDDASVFVYSRSSAQVASGAIIGVSDGTRTMMIVPRHTTDQVYLRMNSASSDNSASTDASGFWGLDRSESDNFDLYKNGTFVENIYVASNGVPTADVFVLAINVSGTAGDFWSGQCSVAGWGESLTSAQQDSLFVNFERAMDSLGTGVVAYEPYSVPEYFLNPMTYTEVNWADRLLGIKP